MAEFDKRTEAFFSQNVNRVADKLVSGEMALAIPQTSYQVRLVEVEAFTRTLVGKRYKDWGIEDLSPGDLWNPPARAIRQSLVIIRDRGVLGACVRLISAKYWDTLTEAYVDRLITAGQEFKQGREGDIAKYFGLALYERSELRFLDESNTLYIIRGGQVYNRKVVGGGGILPENANGQLSRLLE